MEFSEKLRTMRKSFISPKNSLPLNVSRQAITKWETGSGCQILRMWLRLRPFQITWMNCSVWTKACQTTEFMYESVTNDIMLAL